MFVKCCAVFVQQWLDVMWSWGNVCQVLCSLCSAVMWCDGGEMFVRCCAVFVQQWCDVMWSWGNVCQVLCSLCSAEMWCDVIVGNVCQVLCSLCSAVIRCDVIVGKCLSGVVQSLFSSDVMWCDREEMFVRCCAVFVQQWLDVMWSWGNVCQVLCSLCSAVIVMWSWGNVCQVLCSLCSVVMSCDVIVRKCLSGVVQSLFSSD